LLLDYFNLTYKSSENDSLARFYSVNINRSDFIEDISLNYSLSSNLSNGEYGSSFGEVFTYSSKINFSISNAPDNDVYLYNKLASNFIYLNSSNSINDSLLTINGSDLSWNFGNVSKGTNSIIVNITGYILDNLSYVRGDTFLNNFNLTYKNTHLSNFNLTSNFNYRVLEPNISISVFYSNNSIPINGTLNYTIVVSNLNSSPYVSRAYNVSVNNNLDDGSNLLSTSLANIGNLENLSFNLGILEVGEIKQINISLFVNDTLRNFSSNKKDELYFYSNITYSSSMLNGRNYSNSTLFVNVINDIRAPVINSIYVNPKVLAVSQNLSFKLFAEDFIRIDSCWVNIVYPNSSQINISNVCNESSFIIPNLQGDYNLTFYVNDSSGNLNISDKILVEVGPLILWNSSLIDNNSNSLNVSVSIYYNDSIIVSDFEFNGSLNINISDFNYDVLFKTYNDSVSIRLNNLSSILNNNKTFGIDKIFNKDGNLVVYGVYSENYSFSNANLRISYSDIVYDVAANLKLSVCEDWNFTLRTCISSWLDYSFILDTNTQELVFNRTSFSAFGIYEYDPPSGGGGGGSPSPPPLGSSGSSSSGGGIDDDEDVEEVEEVDVIVDIIENSVDEICVENWVCTSWSFCVDGLSERKCSDLNNCNGQNYISSNSKTCNLDYNLTGNFISNYFFSEKGSKTVLVAIDKGSHVLKY
ncbi:MAG: hypothetical protein KC550_06115, partial [Nanoarchaeota archaeon]|nr:hypothetical protein [Nanoarchaeota archaeon]